MGNSDHGTTYTYTATRSNGNPNAGHGKFESIGALCVSGMLVSAGGGTPHPHFAKMCSGSEEGSYLRLIDFVYHSTLGLRVLKKRRVSGEV